MKKINYRGKLTEISNDFLGYIKTNLEFTLFTSYEEAENEWAKVRRTSDELGDEHYEYYVYLFEAIKVCGPEIAGNVMLDIMEEYPGLY